MGREAKQKQRRFPDPPVRPFPETASWFDFSPSALLADPDTATLLVRVGLASNALNAQLQIVAASKHASGALRASLVLSSLVTGAAVTFEALDVARSGMARLRRFAHDAGMAPELTKRVGQLCAGKHAASKTLELARNKLGFHWDERVIKAGVMAFARNQNLVWVEFGAEDAPPVHRLAFDVLSWALLPEADTSDIEAGKRAVAQALDEVSSAMHLMIHFFAAATAGYLSTSGARHRTRTLAPR
jgi:hypothetical protein